MTEDRDTLVVAKELGFAVCETPKLSPLPAEILEKIPYTFAKKHIALPLKEESGQLTIALANPLDLDGIEALRFLIDQPIHFVVSPRDLLLRLLSERYQQGEEAQELIASMEEEGEERFEDGVIDLLETSEAHSPIIRLLNLILTEAIEQGASDIHFEPFESELQVRYRIDGVLQERHTPPPEMQAQLLTRIKVLARLDIAERRLPQDGRMKLRLGGREIDFRVSTLPIVHGERIVLRILDQGNLLLGKEHLGMLPQTLSLFERLTRLSEGIVLVTGPTGSGKTTTLYSTLHEIQTSAINLMTIEDPVEYKLDGIAQIQVQPKIGLTFASGLRHILRQDPDVVMVGEIRDAETAHVAIQAALTGHLVFSTLHTNDAPSAITRLVDMGIPPYLLSASMRGVLAQRLVRTLCPHCRVPRKADKTEKKALGAGVEELFEGKGCSHCFGSGYLGRCGIYELLEVDASMQREIAQNRTSEELRQIAIEKGMSSLFDHGKQLVLEGKTTLEEILRVTGGG